MKKKKNSRSEKLVNENTEEYLPRFSDCDLADETGYIPHQSITDDLEIQCDEDQYEEDWEF